MSRRPCIRSWLFVPGDSERKQAKALACGADALILDLEDSVAPARLPAARARVATWLREVSTRAAPQRWVRVNALSSGLLGDDLAALLTRSGPESGSLPQGIVLPKVSAASELREIAAQVAARESDCGVPEGTVGLMVIATETPAAVLSLGEWHATLGADDNVTRRLVGLTWGAEDLGAALGVTDRLDEQGKLTFVFELARARCLLAAAALGVAAIDAVHVDFRDADSLRADLTRARRDGFTAKLAIHPDQVPHIHAAFTPTAAERAWAEGVVAAFAAAAGSGVVSVDGKMVDRPHLLQAQRILASDS